MFVLNFVFVTKENSIFSDDIYKKGKTDCVAGWKKETHRGRW